MANRRQLIPVVGLFAILGVSAYMVVQLDGQAGTLTGDFTNAAAAEVRDAQGQVVLNGPFKLVEEEDDDTERKAALAPTGLDADAAGEAEVEFTTSAPAEQEVEFSIRNVAAGAVYTFVIDGIEVGSATADSRGRAELEVEASMPGTGRR
jgi:hypothetical protein